MAAKTIKEIRAGLANGKAAEDFAAGFAESYFAQALGVLPKAEIDLLVFKLLIDQKLIDPNGSIFSVARALNITLPKARSLLLQYQLRFLDSAEADDLVGKTLAHANFSVDEKRLSFGIESPLIRAMIDSRLKERGVFADISLSGEILRVPLAQFDQFFSILMSEEKAKALEKALKKDGHLKEGTLVSFLKKYGTAAASGAAGAAGKSGFSTIMDGVGQFLSGDGVATLGEFIEGIG